MHFTCMRLFLYYKFNVVIFYSIKLDIVIFILNRERTFIKKKKKKGKGWLLSLISQRMEWFPVAAFCLVSGRQSTSF